MQGPVYFKGGTFGSTGSGPGWTIAITAFLTALGALSVGFGLEIVKRRLDRKTLAGTILAEIDAILRLFVRLNMEEILMDARTRMEKHLAETPSKPWPGIPGDTLTFPVTVYEKCADRIGTLGRDAAADVVEFYNFLNGYRVAAKIALATSGIPLESRITSITNAIEIIISEKSRTESLQRSLNTIANRPWFA